jgi:hypothetical protein
MASVKVAKERKPRQPKVKPEDLLSADNDNHEVVEKPKRAPRSSNSKNEIIKGRLSLIIDMLDVEDSNDKSFVRNIPMCVKHLKELLTLL